MSDEVKVLLEQQGKAIEEFKSINDRRLAELEKRGTDMAELHEQLGKVTAELAEIKRRGAEIAAEKGGSASGDIEERSYHDSFVNKFVRKGDIRDIETRTMSVGSDSDGGFWVPKQVSDRIVTRVYAQSPLRQICTVETIGRTALELPIDSGDIDGGHVSEMGSRPETNSPGIGLSRIVAHDIYAMPGASQAMLDDSAYDIEAYLSRKAADKLARVEGAVFATGTGAGQARGIFSVATAATADSTRAWGTIEHVGTGTSGGFGTAPNGSDKIISLVHALKAQYRANAKFVMNSLTLGEVMKLKANGDYIWAYNDAVPGAIKIRNFDVVECEDAPAIAANSLSIAFGDFSEGYTIVDRTGLTMLRDNLTVKGRVLFFFTKRVGGDVVNSDAIKVLKFA